jgi:hypothetical protein
MENIEVPLAVAGSTGRKWSALFSPLIRRVFLGGCIVFFLIACFATALARAPIGDEGRFVGVAETFLKTGHLGCEVMLPWGYTVMLPRVEDYTYWTFPGYPLALAVWLKAAGSTLVSARAFSILCGVLMILCWYRLVATLTGSKFIALLTTLLLSTDVMTIVRCSLARTDSLSALLSFAAFLAYVSQRRASLLRALLWGHSLAAFGMLFHPNGLFGVAGIILLMLLDRRSLSSRLLVWCAAPYLLAGAAYAIFVLQAPDIWSQQLANHAGGRASGLRHPLEAVSREFYFRYFTAFGFSPNASFTRKLLILVLGPYLAASLTCLFWGRIRKAPGAAFFLGVFGFIWVYFTFFDWLKYYAYLLHLMPYYAVFVATASVYLYQRYNPARPVIAAGLAGLLLFNLTGVAIMIRQNIAHAHAYSDVVRRVSRDLLERPGEMAQAPEEFAFDLGFDRVKGDRTSRYLVTNRPLYAIVAPESYVGFRVEEVFQEWAPRVTAVLRDCYTRERVGDYTVYRRNEGCRRTVAPPAGPAL